MANLVPDLVRPQQINVINVLADILNKDVIEALSKTDQEAVQHFSKSVAITLGRLG